jgi:hypothetical protein
MLDRRTGGPEKRAGWSEENGPKSLGQRACKRDPSAHPFLGPPAAEPELIRWIEGRILWLTSGAGREVLGSVMHDAYQSGRIIPSPAMRPSGISP